MRALLSMTSALILVIGARQTPPDARAHPAASSATEFSSVALWLNAAEAPAAAWQLRARFEDERVRLVGIEGSETEPWREPPHHDPRALGRREIVLAALSTEPTSALPAAPLRLARLHVAHPKGANLRLSLEDITVGDTNGKRLRARIEAVEEKR